MTNLEWIVKRSVLMLLAVMATCMGQTTEYIAHRGASYLAPENTMASVMLAWEVGADSVEVDVYLSADQRIVVIHDKDTKRTAGVELAVKETSSETLRGLDVGRYKDEKYAGEKIPFLKDVIDSIPKGKRLYIEIKCGMEIVPLLKDMIKSKEDQLKVSIICFDLDVIAEAKKQMPAVPAYWLIGSRKDEQTKAFLPHDPACVQTAKEKHLDGLDVHYAGVTHEFVQAINKADMKLYVWTVDDPGQARKLKQFGVDGITTNRPAWLKKQIDQVEK